MKKETVKIYTYTKETGNEPWCLDYFCDLSGDKSGEGCQHDGGKLYEVPHPYKVEEQDIYGTVILDVRGFICSLWVINKGEIIQLRNSWGECETLELKE